MTNSANKGKRTEKEVEKQLNATRKAGPNNPDLKKGKDRIEVKNYKNPLTNVIVSAKGFNDKALEHAEKNMSKVQLREVLDGKSKLVKKRK